MRNYDTDTKAIRMFKDFVNALQKQPATLPMSWTDGLLLLVIAGMVCFAMGVVLATGKPI